MRGRAEMPIMLAMTRPSTTPKVLLVEDRRGVAESRAALPIRRYRLARLRSDPRPIRAKATGCAAPTDS